MLNSRTPTQVGYYGRRQILMAARSSNLLTQLIQVSLGQPALCPFLNPVRSPRTPKKPNWVGLTYREAGSPSNKILVPTLVSEFCLPHRMVDIPGGVPTYPSQT